MWVQKWSKMSVSKVVPRPLGVLKQVVEGHFEPLLTHISPFIQELTLQYKGFWGNAGI